MDPLSFTEQTIADHVLLITLGRMLDNNNAEQMVRTITQAQDRGYTFIIMDCEQLEFLSSAGVGAILGTIETSRDQGGDIILCNVSETTAHVLQVLDLLDFLKVKKTRSEALAICGA
ncbi:MAG: anti-sigma factor antagonist [Candidatus Zixiibacteriota bacterium]